MNISIAIADQDREYIERLSEVLQQYPELMLHIYTSGQKLQTAIESARLDIVLFDPDISEKKISFSGVKLPICLYSDESQNIEMYSEFTKVFKYQRISNIYKEIVREYADKAGYSITLNHSQNTQIIAVYSPVGGSGKTTVSLAVASKLVSLGKTALFISMEQLDSSVCVNPKKEEGITMLIQNVSDKNVNFELKTKGILKQGMNEMIYIEGFDRIVDYCDVGAEEISSVLEGLRRCGICDFMVIDMGSSFDTIGKAVMDIADSVFVIEKPGELPAVKMNLFASQAIANTYGNKMKRICNFAENNTVYHKDLPFETIGVIHNYGNLQLRNVVKAINGNQEISLEQMLKK